MARRGLTDLDPRYDPARPPASRADAVRLSGFATGDARVALFRDVQSRLAAAWCLRRRHPAAAPGSLTRGSGDMGRFATRELEPATALPAAHILATLGPMTTVGINVVAGPLARGRAMTGRQPPVVLVSRALAARHWRGQLPIGEQIRLPGLGDGAAGEWRTIVGVVSDISHGDPLSSAIERGCDLPPAAASGCARHKYHRAVPARTRPMGRQALQQVLGGIDSEPGPRPRVPIGRCDSTIRSPRDRDGEVDRRVFRLRPAAGRSSAS